MNRCKDCRNWTQVGDMRSPKESQWGVCVWLTGIHGAPTSPIRGKARGKVLETLEDFGCTCWEPKVAEHGLRLTATERARMVEAGYSYTETRLVEGE